jgi:hypothetical protein
MPLDYSERRGATGMLADWEVGAIPVPLSDAIDARAVDPELIE